MQIKPQGHIYIITIIKICQIDTKTAQIWLFYDTHDNLLCFIIKSERRRIMEIFLIIENILKEKSKIAKEIREEIGTV